MSEKILEKVKGFDKNVNGIDLQEFEVGIKNMTEADYKMLADEIKQKDKEMLNLLNPSLEKVKKAYDKNEKLDSRIVNILKLTEKIKEHTMTDSENIGENREELQETLGAAKEMLVNFFEALQTTMVKGKSDYTFYKSLRDKTQKFLQLHQSNTCNTYVEYQAQMYQIANFINENIKNNGTGGSTNPAYKYIREHVPFPTVGTDAFINLGNTLNKLTQAKTQLDIENIKGEAYENTREMLGKSLYGTGNKGYLGMFNTSENMGKLQEDIINSEEMKKYPDLKGVSEFLKNFKKESKNTKQMLGLQDQYQKLIKSLNGKVPTKFILFLQQKFDDQKEAMQKEINTIYSEESIDAVQSIAIMKVLGTHRENMQPKLTQEELMLAAKEYKETGKFNRSVMTGLEMMGVSSVQVHTEIEKIALDIRVQQYNTMMYDRLSSFVTENALDADQTRSDVFSKKNKLFAIYNDVKGIGAEGGTSDASIQYRKHRSEQIVINIAITAFSGGIGGLAARAALGAVKATTLGGGAMLFAARMIVEGSVFHGVHTITTGAISGDIHTMLAELKHPRAWAQSVLYIGVMNKVGTLFGKGMMPGLKSIEKATLLQKLVDPSKLMSALKKGIQFPIEIAGMMATDQIVSLTFDQRFQEVNTESIMQTVTLVVGLKLAHKLVPRVPEQGAITSDDIHITDIIKTEGVVTDIKYTQKVMNTIDAKIDYLAKIMKIKSSARGNVTNNILNDMLSELKKNPDNKKLKSQFEQVQKNIQELKKEGKVSEKLEKKLQEVSKVMEVNTKEEHYESIVQRYTEGQTKQNEKYKELVGLYKKGTILWDEVLKQKNDLEQKYPTYMDVAKAKADMIVAKYGYDISQEKIQSYIRALGNDIQTGGSNAKGVHILEGTNLVAVIKTPGSYIYELPQRKMMEGLKTSRVPRVVDVFLHEGKLYKIMEKSPGKSIEELTTEEKTIILQEHYDNFIKDIKEIENCGLQVDPSKPSNFFYDKETGFHFIDLGLKEEKGGWSMFNQFTNFNAKGILDNAKIQKAVDKEGQIDIQEYKTVEKNGDKAKTKSETMSAIDNPKILYEKLFTEMDAIRPDGMSIEQITLFIGNITNILRGISKVDNNRDKTIKDDAHFQQLSIRNKTQIKNFLDRELHANIINYLKNSGVKISSQDIIIIVDYFTIKDRNAKKNVLASYADNGLLTLKSLYEKKIVSETSSTPGDNVGESMGFSEEGYNNIRGYILSEKRDNHKLFYGPNGFAGITLERGGEAIDRAQHLNKSEVENRFRNSLMFVTKSNKVNTSKKSDIKEEDIVTQDLRIEDIDYVLVEKSNLKIAQEAFGKTNIKIIGVNSIEVTIESLYEGPYKMPDYEGAIEKIMKTDGNVWCHVVRLPSDTYIEGKDFVTGKKNGEVSEVETKRLIDKSDKIAPEIVKENAKLNDIDRITTAKKMPGLENMTTDQEKAILEAHNIGASREGAGVYKYTRAEIKTKVKILDEAGFSGVEKRLLLESGICGNDTASTIEVSSTIELRGESKSIEHCRSCTLDLGGSQLDVLKVSEFSFWKEKFSTPYVILDQKLYKSSGGERGYKGLREDEIITLGRTSFNDRFDFPTTVSRNHVEITLENGTLKIKDLYSSNATKIYDMTRLEVEENAKVTPKITEIEIESKITKTEMLMKFTNGPIKISEDFIAWSDPRINNALLDLTNRGKKYDEMKLGGDFLTEGRIKYHGTYSGRPIVEVKMQNGNSEFFYKSTGWAGKAGEGEDGTTNGMWQVFGGFANIAKPEGQTRNWFIKDINYKNYYGSETFKSIAQSLDNNLINKYGLKNVDEVHKMINFQNIVHKENTYEPSL